MENHLYFLIKFGSKENIIDLQKTGKVFLNTISYFKNLELNKERGDNYEGIERIEQVNYLEIQVGNRKIQFDAKGAKNILRSAQYRIEPKIVDGNIYSLYAVTTESLTISNRLDDRLIEFGNCLLIITNPTVFLEKLFNSIYEEGYRIKYGPVTYYNENTYNGDLGIFYKPDRFEHQNEYRILVENFIEKPLIFEIGSIEDISELVMIEELQKVSFKKE